jgi:hypothetical protein
MDYCSSIVISCAGEDSNPGVYSKTPTKIKSKKSQQTLLPERPAFTISEAREASSFISLFVRHHTSFLQHSLRAELVPSLTRLFSNLIAKVDVVYIVNCFSG